MSDLLLPLIADASGYGRTDFLSLTPQQWADREMLRRYRQGPPVPGESPTSLASRCYQFLLSEHALIRSWFQEDNKLSHLMMSRTVGEQLNRPLGDGIGWDFDRAGELNPRATQFKGTIVALERSTTLYDIARRPGAYDLHLSGVARFMRGAYQTRAEGHPWIALEKREGSRILSLSGEEQCRRWVAFRVYSALLKLGTEPEWAWDASGSRTVFGPIESDARQL